MFMLLLIRGLQTTCPVYLIILWFLTSVPNGCLNLLSTPTLSSHQMCWILTTGSWPLRWLLLFCVFICWAIGSIVCECNMQIAIYLHILIWNIFTAQHIENIKWSICHLYYHRCGFQESFFIMLCMHPILHNSFICVYF